MARQRMNRQPQPRKQARGDSGFGLVELLIVIVIIGILAAVATSSLDNALGQHRVAKTEREMQKIVEAIGGDAGRMTGGIRSDFGYVGDVGAFPDNLGQLYTNPGYSTWAGPYVDVGLIEDSIGFLVDAWGSSYQYNGSLTVLSVGSGTTLSNALSGSTADYLLNRLVGLVADADGNYPGGVHADSVILSLTVPDGIGGLAVVQINPLWNGSFEFDSLPVGRRELSVVYTPTSDTLHRMVTVLPRNRNDVPHQYKFPIAYFSGSRPVSSSITLRPDGAGSSTNLTADGCGSNYLCVDESMPDEDGTRLVRASNSYANDLYSMENPSVTGSISSIIVFARARTFSTVGDIKPLMRTNGGEYDGAEQGLSSAWADISSSWALNPATGVAWAWTDIANIEAGLSLKGQNVTKPAYCTQVWLVVEYVP